MPRPARRSVTTSTQIAVVIARGIASIVGLLAQPIEGVQVQPTKSRRAGFWVTADFKGSVFDSSLGREPFAFTLGAGDVIQGWDEGIRGMKVGGIRRLIVPPSKAYSGSRTGGIPPYSTLVFEIELLSAESPVVTTGPPVSATAGR